MSRLQFEADVTLGKMLQPEPKAATDALLKYVRAASIGQDGTLIEEDAKSMWFGVEEVPRLAIAQGDILVVEGGDAGRSIIARDDLPGWGFQNSINRVRATRGNDPRYLQYFLLMARSSGYLAVYCDAVSIPHLTAEKLKGLPVNLPPPTEQRAIADYLDRETAQIDSLIEEQQRLIDLLRERRAAAVAAGTAWDGIERGGWALKRLSWLFDSSASGTTPANEDITYSADAEVPWVTTSELRESVITETQRGVSAEVIDNYSALRIHPSGSLLIAMYGATIGRMGILGVPAASNQACCALVGPSGVLPEFVQYSLLGGRDWLLLEASGGGQPNINQEKVRSFRIPVPSLMEQKRIVSLLNEQTSRIDLLIEETERFIALSRERRAALITAAVTGQIDVQDEVA